ncbi:uncharacterized protein LOC132659874 isoform X2 [Ovis aries]|uniref:uncharacterized protein LOC132659874 isoform X2 n=1 Tax=Ovis aries TaxID=9940 RepID=UPI0029528E59|nr:uncharacterized protein LOC132659874 isoform X2 [Ovis aries]
MLSRGSPLTPARIPPFQLPAHGQRLRSNSRGLQPSEGGPALPHVPTVTAAHGFQVLAQRPQVLSAEAPLWGTSPETPADPSWSLDQPEILRTPPHGRFQNLSKVDRILTLLTVSHPQPLEPSLQPGAPGTPQSPAVPQGDPGMAGHPQVSSQ